MAADFVYTVQAGEHPWSLARRYLKSPAMALQLMQRNHIADEHHIPPGTQLRIPTAWLKLESAHILVLGVSGEATVKQPNSQVRPVVVSEYLQAPAALHTGATGSISLQFADGSRVLVSRDSELQLRTSQRTALGKGSIIELGLLRGSLENQVTPIGKSGGRFEIRTPAAIAAVRGTQFRVSAGQDAQGESLRTEVITGAVNVANPNGQTTALALQGSVAQAGQAPGQPLPLLAAPALDGLPETLERLPIDWPLPPVAGASGYRSQLAPGTVFLAVDSDETTPGARIRARDVADGRYVLRVRAIDARGLEGQTAERALVVHTQPPPPLLIEPAADALTTAARPAYRWTQAAANTRYRVQTLAGSTLVDEQVVEQASAQPAGELPPGTYQWRVAAIHPDKGQGPWGDAHAFRRVLPGPDVAIPAPQDGNLSLSWQARQAVDHYRIQLDRDAGFAAPHTDASSAAAHYLLHDLSPGRHFVRVQAVADDGYVEPWGSTQFFDVPEPAPQHWRALWVLLPLLGLL